MSKNPAALARAVARRNPRAIAIVFIDEDGHATNLWMTRRNMLELAGAANGLANEINWSVPQQGKERVLTRRRRRA